MSLLTARLQQRGATPGRHSKPPRNGRIAQLVEQLTLNQRVLGSSPSASTILHRRKQMFSTAAESCLFDMV
jgi:hypothetical protein